MDKPTSSRVAQDAAEERVDHYRKALGPFVVAAEHSRMPMIFTDAEIERHPVVFANDSFLSLTGFSRGEILGKGIAYLLKEVLDPKTHSDIEAALDRQADGTWEAQCRRANGTEYLAAVLLSPVLDDQGVIRQNVLCFVEVPARIDRLLAQRYEFNALYEQAPGFIATLEGEGHRFTFANASYKRLVGREQLVGQRVNDVLPEFADQGLIDLLDQVFRTGEPYVGKAVPVRISEGHGPSSGLHYVNFVYQPVRHGEGEITGVFVEGYDVTAERLSAEQLSLLQGEIANASRLNSMGELAASLAHELNQPLTAAANFLGAAELMLRVRSEDEPLSTSTLVRVREAIRRGKMEVLRSGDIVRTMREFVVHGDADMKCEHLSLIIGDAAALGQATIIRNPIEVRYDLAPEADYVLADRVSIQQVLVNLIRNAAEAMAAQRDPVPAITISSVAKSGFAEVSVADNGPGIPAEIGEDLFTAFSTSKPTGLGVGLSICKRIIESHGGQLRMVPGQSRGAIFQFTLPIFNVREVRSDG